jgi:hypothetical protein
MQIRAGAPSDRSFLDEMLFEAFFWNAAVERPLLSRFREEAEFARIFDAWGRPGDRALIAGKWESRAPHGRCRAIFAPPRPLR